MKQINNYILEKLKVTKYTNDSPSDFHELTKLYTAWRKRQISKYPEIPLKGIYRTNKIDVPISEENPLRLPYVLTKLTKKSSNNQNNPIPLLPTIINILLP